MNLVDTHCHLDFDHYDKDRENVLERAWNAGLTRILVPGIDILTSQAAVQLAESYSNIYAAVGVHPNSAGTWDEWALDALEVLAVHPKVVALGEIGLDYYRDRAPKNLQRDVFLDQLKLASRLDLPVVIHTRNSNPANRACISDVINLLSNHESKLAHPGVVHSYSGNLDEADLLVSFGFYLGITGPVTYKNASALRTMVASLPIDRLLIETDGPFLTPHPKRGKRNEPAYVRYIADKLAEILELPLKTVADVTSGNAARLFGWGNIV
jgi:TatD DNase family protein